MARGTGGYSLTSRNISTYLRIRPLAVNKDPEKVRESWRLDNLPYGADSGLEFVIFLPLKQFHEDLVAAFQRPPPRTPRLHDAGCGGGKKTEQVQMWASARKLDERGMCWRWSLKSRNRVYSVSGSRELSGKIPALKEPRRDNFATTQEMRCPHGIPGRILGALTEGKRNVAACKRVPPGHPALNFP